MLFKDIVEGRTYKISDLAFRFPGGYGYDPLIPYTGTFVSRSANGERGTFKDVKDKNGRDQGLVEFNNNYAYYDYVPPAPIVEVVFDVKKSELEPSDIFTGDEFKQGDRVIRIGEKNGWIFNRAELETWWKKKPNTNPLVSGTQQMAEGTKIEYGTLNILPSGGRRKTRRVQPKTKKEAKKSCSPGYEVYNYRKTRKGVFYDCAPKRKTRRSHK